MSFTARAMGTGAPRFIVHNRAFADQGDVFDVADAINSAASRLNVDLDGASTGFAPVINTAASVQFVWELQRELAGLVGERAEAIIRLEAYHAGGAFDSGSFVTKEAYVSQRVEPYVMAGSFLQDLADCGLNHWGFVRAITEILSEYSVRELPERPWCFIAIDL